MKKKSPSVMKRDKVRKEVYNDMNKAEEKYEFSKNEQNNVEIILQPNIDLLNMKYLVIQYVRAYCSLSLPCTRLS